MAYDWFATSTDEELHITEFQKGLKYIRLWKCAVFGPIICSLLIKSSESHYYYDLSFTLMKRNDSHFGTLVLENTWKI